jgi:hypothetical protein
MEKKKAVHYSTKKKRSPAYVPFFCLAHLFLVEEGHPLSGNYGTSWSRRSWARLHLSFTK